MIKDHDCRTPEGDGCQGCMTEPEPTEEGIVKAWTLWAIEGEVRCAIEQGIGVKEIADAIKRGCGEGLKGGINKFLIVEELTTQ
jgi:hypothetical protein